MGIFNKTMVSAFGLYFTKYISNEYKLTKCTSKGGII